MRLPCMLEQVATTHERTKADQLKRIVGAEVGITVQSMVSQFHDLLCLQVEQPDTGGVSCCAAAASMVEEEDIDLGGAAPHNSMPQVAPSWSGF